MSSSPPKEPPARASSATLSPGNCQPPSVVLSIAGLDPSSGAGLTADLKVFAAHRLYGVAAATALTVQSTRGVRRSVPTDPLLLEETLACLAEDLLLAGIKIGMLASAANVEVVARFLESRIPAHTPVVLDPVLQSSSGHPLLEPSGLALLRERLLPRVTCLTPNTAELLLLAGPAEAGQPASPDASQASPAKDIENAALRLAERVPGLSIAATGGHLDSPDDLILTAGLTPGEPPGEPLIWLPGEWVPTPATHGTGCAYSSALLCGLVAGLPLLSAAQQAKHYVTEALRAAQPIGQGGGSMHHFYTHFPSHNTAAPADNTAPAADNAPPPLASNEGDLAP